MKNVSMEMKKVELLKVASELNVEVKKSWNKTQIVEAVMTSQKVEETVEIKEDVQPTLSQEEMMAQMANMGRAAMNVEPVKEEINQSPVKKNVKDYTTKELLEYVSLRLKEGAFIYVTNKRETIAVRVTHVENNMIKGYTSTNRSAVFSVYPKALINGTFKFVTGKNAGDIHNRLIKDVKETKDNNSRYVFAIERSGDYALVDRKEKTITKPGLDKSLVNAVLKTKFVDNKAKERAKDKPSLAERLNAMYMSALK